MIRWRDERFAETSKIVRVCEWRNLHMLGERISVDVGSRDHEGLLLVGEDHLTSKERCAYAREPNTSPELHRHPVSRFYARVQILVTSRRQENGKKDRWARFNGHQNVFLGL